MGERKAKKLLFPLVPFSSVIAVDRHIIYTNYHYKRLLNIYFTFNVQILSYLLPAEILRNAHQNLVV